MPRFARPRLTAVLAAALIVAAAWWFLASDDTEPDVAVPAPFQVSVPEWEELLTGDAERDEQTYRELAQVHPGLDGPSARAAAELAVAVAEADLSGQGRDQWEGYWPPPATTTTPPAARCTRVSALAASPAAFAVVGKSDRVADWVKVLVPYAGKCGKVRYTSAYPGVEYVYLTRVGDGPFTPVRDWMIPQTDPDAGEGPGDLPEWQLAELGPCGVADDRGYRLRTLAAAAFTRMCEAAGDDGVVLVVESGYRTRAEQAALFASAVEHYGSDEVARQWVAYADDKVCLSKHCAGTAVNVEPDFAATTWLNEVVGCASVTDEGTQVVDPSAEGECAAGAAPVKQAQLYGFVAPLPRIPGYLEFVLETGETAAPVPDCSPAGVGVDVMVASVFRCRLQRAGVDAVTVERVVAEALVVSKCASGWQATARVFAGRYVSDPHPDNDRFYTEAGVFALRAELVDAGWVVGDVLDPVVNINAAASLWLATRGWEQSACATGTDPGLPVGPVLPSYGGPQLPAWATGY